MNWLRRLNRRYLLRYRIEYGIALALLYGVRALPPKFAWNAARSLGRLCYRLGVRRKVMLTNLAIAFPEMSDQERKRIARLTLEHFACMFVDIVFQRRMLTANNVFHRIKFVGWARDYMNLHGVKGLVNNARRRIFLTGHFGNWELASSMFALLGVRIDPVFRAAHNPFIDRLVRRVRLDTQYEVIERRGAVQAMLDRFDRRGNVGFLFDQEAVYGLYVPFFGRIACTHKTPAVLARDHKVKIFFGVVERKGDFLQYEARGELLDLSHHTDLEELTLELVHLLEAEIRRAPEQYFWMHRRWKRVGVHGKEHVPEARR